MMGTANGDWLSGLGEAVPSPVRMQQPPDAGAPPPARKAHVKSPSKAPQCLI